MNSFSLNKKQKKNLYRVIIAFIIVATLMIIEHLTDIDMPFFVCQDKVNFVKGGLPDDVRDEYDSGS